MVPVFREEGWHSMDLCAEMLVNHCPPEFKLETLVPKFRKTFGWIPGQKAKNLDRWYNRWRVFPYFLEKNVYKFTAFHIVDHSYSHLVHHLPEGRAGIYCHDLDAFECVLNPKKSNRPTWYRKMMARVFDGFKKAKFVFCNSNYTVQQVKNLGIWDPTDIIYAPLGVAPEFSQSGESEPGDFLLHVGSCIPRKRVDILLKVFSEISKVFPDLNLIQAGGVFTKSQNDLINSLGIGRKVFQKQGLSRKQLAKLYRGAKCLLLPSEAEGFGIPLIEAMSCGCPILCSDIPVLQEVGGSFGNYCPVNDVTKWVQGFQKIVSKKIDDESSSKIAQHLQKYSWKNHSLCIFNVYKCKFGV